MVGKKGIPFIWEENSQSLEIPLTEIRVYVNDLEFTLSVERIEGRNELRFNLE